MEEGLLVSLSPELRIFKNRRLSRNRYYENIGPAVQDVRVDLSPRRYVEFRHRVNALSGLIT
jgi:hypothetical protein